MENQQNVQDVKRTPVMISLSRITAVGVQTRAELDERAIEEYAGIIRSGIDMEPAMVCFERNTDTLWLASGHHRLAAYRRAGRDKMPCYSQVGGKKEAIAAGVVANLGYSGVRMSARDKTLALEMVLCTQPESGDRVIAELVRCHPDTVAKHRERLESADLIPRVEARVGLDGRTRSVPAAKQPELTPAAAADDEQRLDVANAKFAEAADAEQAAPQTPGQPSSIAFGHFGDTEDVPNGQTLQAASAGLTGETPVGGVEPKEPEAVDAPFDEDPKPEIHDTVSSQPAVLLKEIIGTLGRLVKHISTIHGTVRNKARYQICMKLTGELEDEFKAWAAEIK